MYAIIETGGKQIRVEEGSTIFVEKLDVQEGEAVVFDKVVAYCNRSLRVGTPYVKGVKMCIRDRDSAACYSYEAESRGNQPSVDRGTS